jgi:hypothetical protein
MVWCWCIEALVECRNEEPGNSGDLSGGGVENADWRRKLTTTDFYFFYFSSWCCFNPLLFYSRGKLASMATSTLEGLRLENFGQRELHGLEACGWRGKGMSGVDG